MLALLATAAIGFSAWIVFRSAFYAAKVRRSRFQSRLPLEDDLFYERYYSSSGLQKSIVISLRHELASAFNVDASKLLATDRFQDELSVVRGWEYVDDAPDELFLLNRDREKRLGVTIPLAKLQTADDYIRTIASYESTK
jgi:hypothetical protein